MFCGFFGLNRSYVDEDRNTSLFLLAFFMWLTGMGSCAGPYPHYYSFIFTISGFIQSLISKVLMPPSMLPPRTSQTQEVPPLLVMAMLTRRDGNCVSGLNCVIHLG